MMILKTTNRIEKIVECVKYERVADIATDHCYIPIQLCKTKKIKKVIACDINEMPLKSGIQNIKDNDLENIIETRLGDGLSPLIVNEVDTIIIAGVGGSLICKILEDNIEKVKTVEQLILQPQADLAHLRRFLNKIGFKIDNEYVVNENRLYTILDCSKGSDEYTEDEFILGKNITKDESYKKIIEYHIGALEKIKSQLINADKEKYLHRIEEIEKEQNIYKRGLENC